MQRHQQWVVGLAVAAGTIGFTLLALAYANPWWLSFLVTTSILAWLAGVLWALYCRPGERAIVLGALIAGFLYILLALGPWFRGNVGPWLLTSRAFHFIETQLLKREVPSLGSYQTVSPAFPGFYGGTAYSNPFLPGGGGIWTSYPPAGSSTILLTAPAGPSTFAAVGHWLSAWLAAGAGALAAGLVFRRGQAQPAAGIVPAGENPFREARP